jgi:hypothetical protein
MIALEAQAAVQAKSFKQLAEKLKIAVRDF